MAWFPYTFVACLLVQLAVCKPPGWPSTPTTDRPCVKVSETLGEIIQQVDPVLRLLPGDFQQLTGYITKLDISNPTKRERVICSLEGISSLSEMIDTVKYLELDYNIIKSMYDYISYDLRMTKFYLQQDIDTKFDTAGIDKVIAEQWIEWIKDVEASGILGLDPVGEAAIQEIVSNEEIDIHNVPMEPPSVLSLETQCSQLTTSLMTVATTLSSKYLETNSNDYRMDVSDYIIDVITRWIGIVPTEQTIKPMICDLLVKVRADGFDGIYKWTKEMSILKQVLKTGYPYVQQIVVDAQRFLDLALTSTHSNIPNRYNSFAPTYTPTSTRRTHEIGNYQEKVLHGIVTYGSPRYDFSKYSRKGHDVPMYGAPRYTSPEYRGPSYRIPQYGVPVYGKPGFGVDVFPNQDKLHEIYRKMQIVFDNMKLMGLFSLADDLTI